MLFSILLVSCGDVGGDSPAAATTPVSYIISGEVSGATAQGVTINLTGDATKTVTTDSTGFYSFAGLANGNYTVTPVKTGYVFNQASTSVNVSGSNVSGRNFIAAASVAQQFALFGSVTGDIKKDVLISLSVSGKEIATTITNVDGIYSFSNLVNGIYTVTPILTGYSFNPNNLQATINNANTTLTNNFISTALVVPTYTISGSVTGATLQGVTVKLTGNSTLTTTTDVDGKYSFTGLANGNYTITPDRAGYVFSPSSSTANVSGANVSVSAITATLYVPPTYSLSGTVTGAVKKDVLITLTGTSTATTTTNTSGNYTFPGLANGTYTAVPSLTGYIFTPASNLATINNGSATFSNFISTQEIVPTYSIAGTVSGATQSGVTINLTGAATKTITTDASGNYSFTTLSNGNYTVTPSKTGYTFNPASTAVSVSGASISGPNFIAVSTTPLTYKLSGTVSGDVLLNVLITLSGASNATTTTNASGNYSFTGLNNGTYTAVPSLAGYTFDPTSNLVTINNGNATFSNFIATQVIAPTYSISGSVSGAILPGVTINLTGAATKTFVTDSIGNYSFTGLTNGNYTVTPVLTGYTFSPSSVPVSVSGANVSGPFFIATVFVPPTNTLSGTVTGAVLQNVLVTLSGAGSATTNTNASGNYSFSGLADGAYIATPNLAGYTFSPASAQAVLAGASSTFINFVATAVSPPTFTISGTVSGSTKSGVTITLSGAATAIATTDANGNYSFTALANGSYKVKPTKSGFTFSPSSITVIVNGVNIGSQNFTSSSTSG